MAAFAQRSLLASLATPLLAILLAACNGNDVITAASSTATIRIMHSPFGRESPIRILG